MVTLGGILSHATAHHHGCNDSLQRLSHPFWLQSWVVMGMDWHSSGNHYQRNLRVETPPGAAAERTWHSQSGAGVASIRGAARQRGNA
jgi:hypothetical protein